LNEVWRGEIDVRLERSLLEIQQKTRLGSLQESLARESLGSLQEGAIECIGRVELKMRDVVTKGLLLGERSIGIDTLHLGRTEFEATGTEVTGIEATGSMCS